MQTKVSVYITDWHSNRLYFFHEQPKFQKINNQLNPAGCFSGPMIHDIMWGFRHLTAQSIDMQQASVLAGEVEKPLLRSVCYELIINTNFILDCMFHGLRSTKWGQCCEFGDEKGRKTVGVNDVQYLLIFMFIISIFLNLL